MLPPLMFSEEEIEAFVLGMQWVLKRGDPPLGNATGNALAKIAAVLPTQLQSKLESSSLLIGPGEVLNSNKTDLPTIRKAIRQQYKVHLTYHDLKDAESTRTIWPFALAFFDHVHVIVAWCELRQAFRHFRWDRVVAFSLSQERYPKNRLVLLRQAVDAG